MLTSTQTAALEAAATAAVAGEKETGLPADLTIAQWADESGWGVHSPGNNCFGIKAAHGETLSTTEYLHGSQQPITEGQTFEVFPTLTDCFVRHAHLITTFAPYGPAWKQYQQDKQIGTFIQRVAKVYATDPNYGLKLLKIRAMAEVNKAMSDARRPLVNIT